MCVCVCVSLSVDAWWRLTDSVEVEVLCNWFKVDAISSTTKRRLEKDTFQKEDRKKERGKEGRKKKVLSPPASQGVCGVS